MDMTTRTKMQDSSEGTTTASRGMNSTSNSAAPAQRQVLYRKYDPSSKARRVSQLSIASSNGEGPSVLQNSATPPARVLGAHVRSIGSSSLASAGGVQDSNGIPLADDSTSRNGIDYFAAQHSDSTAQSLALRQLERQAAINGYSSSGGSSAGSSTRGHNSTVSTPRYEQHSSNQDVHRHGVATFSQPVMPGLSTVNSRSSQMSATSTHSVGTANQAPEPVQPPPHLSNNSMPRSQSAMATLQRESSTSSRNSGFKQFIPPSAYAATTSSTASSPGQLPSEALTALKPRMSAHLSSALARGLHNVNGMLDGTTPVRLPQSASNVANAVWNKLPPAVQQLKNEIAWEWDLDEGGSTSAAAPQSDLPSRDSNKSPPAGQRSLSTSAIQLPGQRNSDSQRQGSITPQASNSAIAPSLSTYATTGSPSASQWQVSKPDSLRIADQLRLDYVNKQVVGAPPRQASTSTVPVSKSKQPYRPGYQPRIGVWRDQTDYFLDMRVRKASRANGDSTILLHEERLLRRLEKLVELHFPIPEEAASNQKSEFTDGNDQADRTVVKTEAATAVPKSVISLKPADMFGKMLRGIIKSNSVKGLSASDIKAAEQAIVKWQNDRDVTNCSICGAPFNVVTRKHHCRLCGRVVCFLPPNTCEAIAPLTQKPSEPQAPLAPMPGQTALRSSRCSTFVLYDRYPVSGSSQSLLIGTHSGVGHSSLLATGSIREVDLGDFPPIQALASLTTQERDTVEAELDSKRMREMKAGVRVCRECLNTVWKRQKKSQPKREEPWLRLYNALREIQQDIENALPLLSELGSLSDPTVEAVKQFNSTRQTLLKSLTSYDLLAKRIRDLPASAGSPLSPPVVRSTASVAACSAMSPLSSSQERLQRAIYNHAMLFLGEKMAVIKGMGGLTVKRAAAPARASTPDQKAQGLVKLGNDAEENKAEKVQQDKMARLAVLYEQEALVSGYLDDASARRQLEDASALKASLEDLRSEIQRLLR